MAARRRDLRFGSRQRGQVGLSAERVSTRPLLDKLGVKPGAAVAVVGSFDRAFLGLLRERTPNVFTGRPASPCDVVLYVVSEQSDLERLHELKGWIEPNGAIWVVRPKGPGAAVGEMDVMGAGLGAGLVDNKIASFSETQSAMRFVFRLRDRPA